MVGADGMAKLVADSGMGGSTTKNPKRRRESENANDKATKVGVKDVAKTVLFKVFSQSPRVQKPTPSTGESEGRLGEGTDFGEQGSQGPQPLHVVWQDLSFLILVFSSKK